jgi:bacteriocin biosynthesis cyclodehydratase domain-containing protein
LNAAGPLADAAGGPRYRMRPSVEPFVDRDGALCFVRPGGSDLVVRNPDDADVELVRQLRAASLTAEELGRRLGIDAARLHEKLDSLVGVGLVLVRDGPLTPLEGEDAERFSRQLPYLAELGDEARLQRRLRAATVAVIGCGGLGTWAVAALACIGVGRLVLVDDDVVDLSNLNRQILYARANVGEGKAAASARWIAGFDPTIDAVSVPRRIAAEADVGPLVAGADAVVLAADWPPYDLSRWVNAACVEARVPFIASSQVPPVLRVGPTYVPGAGPCFTCHETALRSASRAYDDYVAFRLAEPGIDCTLGPASAVAGGFVGLELMHLLAGRPPATQQFALVIHMRTLQVRREPVLRDPACVTCKHLRDAEQ